MSYGEKPYLQLSGGSPGEVREGSPDPIQVHATKHIIFML